MGCNVRKEGRQRGPQREWSWRGDLRGASGEPTLFPQQQRGPCPDLTAGSVVHTVCSTRSVVGRMVGRSVGLRRTGRAAAKLEATSI